MNPTLEDFAKFHGDKVTTLLDDYYNSLKKSDDLDELNQFVNDLYNSTFAFDEFQFEREIFDRFHQGFLVGDNISMDDLNSFFEEKSKILEKISVEHINKMTHYSEDTKIK